MKQSFQPFHFGIKTSSVFHCDPELPRLPHIQNARRQIVAAPVTNLRERRKVKYAARRLRVGWREKKFKGGPELYRFPCVSSPEPHPSPPLLVRALPLHLQLGRLLILYDYARPSLPPSFPFGQCRFDDCD